MKQLIVNADDYNLTPGVCRGILAAHQEGVVTSTTFMVNLPGARASAHLAGKNPELGVGLHLNLTKGKPVSPREKVPSLVQENGEFIPHKLHPQSRLSREEILLEWEAQLQKFIELMGKAPSHLDSHHHIHALYLPVFFQLAQTHTLPVRTITPEMAREARLYGLKTCDYFIEDFFGDKVGLENLKELLTGIPPDSSCELMCHPGEPDEELRKISSYSDNRRKELEVLTNPELKKFLAGEQIFLTGYARLGKKY